MATYPTVKSIIDTVDARCPNVIADAAKAQWLARLEAILQDRIFLTHAPDPDAGEPFAWTGKEDLTTSTLAVPEPYCVLYEYSVEMLIHQTNGDIDKYNNARILYEDALGDFGRWWLKGHRPNRGPALNFYGEGRRIPDERDALEE